MDEDHCKTSLAVRKRPRLREIHNIHGDRAISFDDAELRRTERTSECYLYNEKTSKPDQQQEQRTLNNGRSTITARNRTGQRTTEKTLNLGRTNTCFEIERRTIQRTVSVDREVVRRTMLASDMTIRHNPDITRSNSEHFKSNCKKMAVARRSVSWAEDLVNVHTYIRPRQSGWTILRKKFRQVMSAIREDIDF